MEIFVNIAESLANLYNLEIKALDVVRIVDGELYRYVAYVTFESHRTYVIEENGKFFTL